MMRGGIIGGVISFLGFTMPSIIVLILFALVLQGFNIHEAGWINGLKIVAVAIVLHAVLGMGAKLASTKKTATIAIIAATVTLLWQSNLSNIIVIIISACIGLLIFDQEKQQDQAVISVPIGKRTALLALITFFAILFLSPIIREATDYTSIAIFDSFYRSGALVFGGGHVVLPLLERELVPVGFLSKEEFLAGYAAAQAVPGPLFTFASYLGMVMKSWSGAIIATVGIFLPAFLLVLGALPFWNELRNKQSIQKALKGVNAAVVGILLAALYDPIFTSTVNSPLEFSFAGILFVLLMVWKSPSWLIVLVGGIAGALFL